MDKNRRIRLGMVGGGQGAFIGAVHRLAARMDDHYQLVAAAPSSDPERARASGAELGLDPDRCYADFTQMAQREATHQSGIDVVSIVTPNHLHYPVAKAFLEAGIHVICDKPLAMNMQEAEKLQALVRKTRLIFAVTHNYSAYPMVRQAREMVGTGTLGKIRLVQVEYPQDWLSDALENSGQKQAEWRTDPDRAGNGGCIGDIGTHAYQLACFVSGLRLHSLSAELTTFVAGRRLDDNAHIMMRFQGGARGLLWSSQVAVGNENNLKLRIYGESGGLEWHQERPDHLWYTPLGEPSTLLTRGSPAMSPAAARLSRVPAGHPEGYQEAFATLYSEIANAIRAHSDNAACDPMVDFPTIDDGTAGMAFIKAAISSSQQNCRWIELT